MTTAGHKLPLPPVLENIVPEGDTEENNALSTHSNDFFANVEAMSATEYLSMVSEQAKMMPMVFLSQQKIEEDLAADTPTAEIQVSSGSKRNRHDNSYVLPIDGSAASIAYLFSNRSILQTTVPSPRYLPQEGITLFATTTLGKFRQLRKYLDECHAQGIGSKQSQQPQTIKGQRQPVPPMKCRKSWYAFCCGEDSEKEGKSEKKEEETETGTETADSSNNKQPPQDWKTNLPKDGFAPSIQLVLQMDQVMVRRVLSHLANCLFTNNNNINITTNTATTKLLEWIYVLLARLEKPLHREDAAVLFGLLKELCRARSQLNLDASSATSITEKGVLPENSVSASFLLRPLNVLIILVGVFFEQGGGVDAVMAVDPVVAGNQP